MKSKTEEMEYDRPRVVRLVLLAELALSKGSSCSSDNLRDEVMPEREDESEIRLSSGSEEASEASSRESREIGEGFWVTEKPGRDITVGGEEAVETGMVHTVPRPC